MLIPRSGNPGSTILGRPKISEPGSCNSNTYTVVVLNSEHEARNLSQYLKTRFVRFMVAVRTVTQDMAPKSFEFVPEQDFNEEWDDEKLFAKYKLTDDEIAAIATIPEMV
ncbi:hypothetical protein [Eggerthella lenta]|uniref:hypothetical protein n=1 Tax=Eggerthella lenta TaxID=84112 RepID=UPI001E4475BD|nr:hypothetical protein [Eggerthella lenta]